jgi:hypothetical protein
MKNILFPSRPSIVYYLSILFNIRYLIKTTFQICSKKVKVCLWDTLNYHSYIINTAHCSFFHTIVSYKLSTKMISIFKISFLSRTSLFSFFSSTITTVVRMSEVSFLYHSIDKKKNRSERHEYKKIFYFRSSIMKKIFYQSLKIFFH